MHAIEVSDEWLVGRAEISEQMAGFDATSVTKTPALDLPQEEVTELIAGCASARITDETSAQLLRQIPGLDSTSRQQKGVGLQTTLRGRFRAALTYIGPLWLIKLRPEVALRGR